MLTAKCNNEIVIANSNLSKKDTYYCKSCGDKLTFKNGQINIPHFAHSKNNSCDYYEYSKGESEEHQEFKLKVLSFFQNNFELSDYQLEYRLIDGRICDLYIELKTGFKFVIEIQYTKISYENFVYRTLDYNKNNIPVLWIFNRSMVDRGYNKSWHRKRINPKNFFRYLILKDNISYFMDSYRFFKGIPYVCDYNVSLTFGKESEFLYEFFELGNYNYNLSTHTYKFKIDDNIYDLNFVGINATNYKLTKDDIEKIKKLDNYIELYNKYNNNYYNYALPYETDKTTDNIKDICPKLKNMIAIKIINKINSRYYGVDRQKNKYYFKTLKHLKEDNYYAFELDTLEIYNKNTFKYESELYIKLENFKIHKLEIINNKLCLNGEPFKDNKIILKLKNNYSSWGKSKTWNNK